MNIRIAVGMLLAAMIGAVGGALITSESLRSDSESLEADLSALQLRTDIRDKEYNRLRKQLSLAEDRLHAIDESRKHAAANPTKAVSRVRALLDDLPCIMSGQQWIGRTEVEAKLPAGWLQKHVFTGAPPNLSTITSLSHNQLAAMNRALANRPSCLEGNP